MKFWNKAAFYTGIFLLVGCSFFPLYWLFITSVKPFDELHDMPPKLYTLRPVIEHYLHVFEQPFLLYNWNSIIVAVYAWIIVLVFGFMMGYAISRLQFPGKAAVLLLVMTTSMFPPMTMVLPIFTGLRDLHLLNTYTGLSLTHAAFGLPMIIWLLSALLNDIPKELDEAAYVDGANRIQAFIKIVLPLSAPAAVTASILIFVHSWNEFLFAFTLNSKASLRTLPVGVLMFQGEHTFPWATISAAILLSILPLVALIFAFQKKIVAGLTNGAVKG